MSRFMRKKRSRRESTGSQLKRALGQDHRGLIKTWAIITGENPMAMDVPAQLNRRRQQSFEQSLSRMSLQFIKIEGMYGNKERPFMIFNLRLVDAKYLASLYEQESFIFGERDADGFVSMYYYEVWNIEKARADIGTRFPDKGWNKDYLSYRLDRCPRWDYVERDSERSVRNQMDAEDFFSRHKNFKFSIPFSIFERMERRMFAQITDFDNMRYNLEHSLDESVSIFSAMAARKRLFFTRDQMDRRDRLRLEGIDRERRERENRRFTADRRFRFSRGK